MLFPLSSIVNTQNYYRLLLAFIMCFMVAMPVKAGNADIVDELTGYLKTSNTREISKHFASTVELVILNEEDVYSKVQAEIIIKDFFYRHNPLSASVVHRLDTNPNYRFAVIQLNTENGKFRVTIALKDTGGRFLITEMRIEFDKE